VSLDPALRLLWTTESRTVGSVCDSRGKYFLKLSTHTIVYLPSHVHNRDIRAGVTCFLQRDVANFSAWRCGGVGLHCAVASVRTVGQTKTPASLPGFCIS
jgi:hypothetical protein